MSLGGGAWGAPTLRSRLMPSWRHGGWRFLLSLGGYHEMIQWPRRSGEDPSCESCLSLTIHTTRPPCCNITVRYGNQTGRLVIRLGVPTCRPGFVTGGLNLMTGNSGSWSGLSGSGRWGPAPLGPCVSWAHHRTGRCLQQIGLTNKPGSEGRRKMIFYDEVGGSGFIPRKLNYFRKAPLGDQSLLLYGVSTQILTSLQAYSGKAGGRVEPEVKSTPYTGT